jgi:hypothetical protein
MRWLAAWTLYWMGDAVSRVMHLAEPLGRLYPVYSRLMCWSDAVQGDGAGPWQDVEEGDDHGDAQGRSND